MTSNPTPGYQPWGQESWNESRPSRVPIVQIWTLSDEWLSRYELLKNLHIKLCRSVTGMWTRTRTRTTGVTAIALLVLCTGELKMDRMHRQNNWLWHKCYKDVTTGLTSMPSWKFFALVHFMDNWCFLVHWIFLPMEVCSWHSHLIPYQICC